jgi:phosphoribosylanthranilate isomerase
MTRIKICGITNLEDALLASELGADALGFVFAESPRRIDPAVVREIIDKIPPFIGRVGVFVNEDPDVVRHTAAECNLTAVQLHGDENLEYIKTLPIPVIKTFRVKDAAALDQIRAFGLSYFMLDAYDADRFGGTGESFDWNIAQEAVKLGKVILSGGLNCDNVAEALNQVHPYAVDVSSGVECRHGHKDMQKLVKFIHEVKSWDSRTD